MVATMWCVLVVSAIHSLCSHIVDAVPCVARGTRFFCVECRDSLSAVLHMTPVGVWIASAPIWPGRHPLCTAMSLIV